jgi:hypothetical protein
MQRGRPLVIAPSVETLLDREQAKLDQVMSEIRGGPRDQNHYAELEERVQGIARRMVAAFRGRR